MVACVATVRTRDWAWGVKPMGWRRLSHRVRGVGDGHGGVKLGAYGQGGQEDIEVVGLGDAAAAGDESGGFQGVFGGVGEAWCDTHVVNNS